MFKHDLFGKPLRTFPDHALGNHAAASMLSCSNSKGAAMEPEHREDRAEVKRQNTERSEPRAEQATFTTPLASEGLEGVRDSHC
ncbi:hypothetical protein [Bradyrhizobium liaoningense]